MKKYIFTAAVAFCSLVVSAQTNKGQWLAGGNGSYQYTKQSEKTTKMAFSPNIGYFFIPGLAGGLRTSLTRVVTKVESTGGNIKSSATSASIEPFVRYYFFPISEKSKLFGDISYGFGQQEAKYQELYAKEKYRTYTLSVGPAFFITPNTAFELTVNYNNVKYTEAYESTGTIGLAVGFQIHLGDLQKK